MTTEDTPSSLAWCMINVIFPLIPFFVEGIIRLIVYGKSVTYSTFSSSTLAMSVGLLCMFISQSLISHKRVIPSQEEHEKMVGVAHLFYGLAIFFFVFFGVIVLITALEENRKLAGTTDLRSTIDIVIFITATIPMTLSLFTQRSFKLRASL